MKKLNFLTSADIVCFKTSGICMEPLIKAGNTLVVKLFISDNIPKVQLGDIIVYKDQGKIFAHRFVVKICREGRKIFKTRSNWSLTLKEINVNDVIGKVISIIRDHRLINPRSDFFQIFVDRIIGLLY